MPLLTFPLNIYGRTMLGNTSADAITVVSWPMYTHTYMYMYTHTYMYMYILVIYCPFCSRSESHDKFIYAIANKEMN